MRSRFSRKHPHVILVLKVFPLKFTCMYHQFITANKQPTACYDASYNKKGKGSPYSITERRVPESIPVLGSQPAGDVSHKPAGRLLLLYARPAVTPATLKRAATNFAAW